MEKWMGKRVKERTRGRLRCRRRHNPPPATATTSELKRRGEEMRCNRGVPLQVGKQGEISAAFKKSRNAGPPPPLRRVEWGSRTDVTEAGIAKLEREDITRGHRNYVKWADEWRTKRKRYILCTINGHRNVGSGCASSPLKVRGGIHAT